MASKPLVFTLQGVLLSMALPFTLSGCIDDEEDPGSFDLPSAIGILQESAIFDEPIGYIASGHSGQISILALKQGRFLTDDDQVAFLRGAPIATGRARLITDLAVFQPDDDQITLIGIDKANEVLFSVPHVIGLDEDSRPLEIETTVSEVIFVDADASGDSPTICDIDAKNGYTTTEDWEVEFVDPDWRVTGSRSGVQALTATDSVPYIGEQRDIAFTVKGEATVGDKFMFSTDNGLTEYDLGGFPTHMTLSPDGTSAAITVYDQESGATNLVWFDTETMSLSEPVQGMPPASTPSRMAYSEDGQKMFVADEGYPAVWEFDLSTRAMTAHTLPFTTFDVANLTDDADRLFVAPTAGREVWLLDLDTDTLIDINHSVPGVQGLSFTSPVMGIEAITTPYPYPNTDDWGVKPYGRSVAVSLYDGSVVFMEEQTGCLVKDFFGPRTAVISASSTDYATSFDTSYMPPYLEQNATNYYHVLVNDCAGLAYDEAWVLRYNSALTAWEVEGVYSGTQSNLAYEDKRYVSDNGEISFVVRAGGEPSQDAWTIQFEVENGALTASGDNTETGIRDVIFDMPGDLTFFDYRVGGSDGGWDVVDERPFVLGFSSASDLVARIEPTTGALEVTWE